MSEAQKVTINLGSAGLTYNTKEGDQVVSVKKSELDAKSEEFESVSISLKRLREENAALSERLREADKVLGNLVSFLDDTVHWVAPINRALLDERKEAAKNYLSKTPKKED